MIFNLFERIVTREYGEDAWDDVLAAADLDGVYTSVGSYPDAEFFRLVEGASQRFHVATYDLVRWFGRNTMPLFVQSHPQLFAPHTSTRSFVLMLNDIIHPEVRKLYPGVEVPEFDFDASAPDVLRMGYVSSRRLCAFAEGLVEGAAEHFGERVSIAQPQCMHRGDDRCLLEIRLDPAMSRS